MDTELRTQRVIRRTIKVYKLAEVVLHCNLLVFLLIVIQFFTHHTRLEL